MAKLSARGRGEVFRLKKSWPDREDDDRTKDSASWLSFRDDGTVLKKVTWKSWNAFQDRWESGGGGWKVLKKVGRRWPEAFPAMKANLLGNGWEEV
jgi:hypothetical protein